MTTPHTRGDITVTEGVLVNDENAQNHCFKTKCEIHENFSPAAVAMGTSAHWIAHANTAYDAFMDAVRMMKRESEKIIKLGVDL